MLYKISLIRYDEEKRALTIMQKTSSVPDIKSLETWMQQETAFEQFARCFYESYGRPFRTEELPEELARIHAPFPTNIYNAYTAGETSEALLPHIGVNHLEYQFFLPDRDIFINKFPRYSNPDVHNNRFFEIIYAYTGNCSIVFHLNDQTEPVALKQGDFLFIPPGRRFQSKVFSDSIILNIGIRQSTFEKAFGGGLPEGSCLGSFFSTALSDDTHGMDYLIFYTDSDDDIHRAVQELCLSYCTDSLYAKNIMNSRLTILFLLLLERYSGHVRPTHPGTPGYLPELTAAILHHLEVHYTTTSLKETAEIFGFSADYLNLIFKKATSVSVGDMILKLKMQKAAELLATTDLPVAAIGEYLGYESVTSLPRIFKKYFGMTPAKYRKEHSAAASF